MASSEQPPFQHGGHRPGAFAPNPHRLPTPAHVRRVLNPLNKLIARTQASAAEAQAYNESLQPDHQKNFYLASMNLLAEKVYHLVRNRRSDPNEVRSYLDILIRHMDLELKKEKNALVLRHLELLETKRNVLQAAATDRGLSDAQFFAKIREVFFPATNGSNGEKANENGNKKHPGRPTMLLQNGFAT